MSTCIFDVRHMAGFPKLVDNKIPTREFLEGVKEIASKIGMRYILLCTEIRETIMDIKISENIHLNMGKYFLFIEKCGQLLETLVLPLRKHVYKINQLFYTNQKKYKYLEDFILLNKIDKYRTARPLIRINRIIELIGLLLMKIVNDKLCQENVKHFLKEAYDIVLKPHQWCLQQKVFLLTYHSLPKRSKLVGQSIENMQMLETYIKSHKIIADKINELIIENNLATLIK